MRKTEYSLIAPRYDKNPVRHRQPKEEWIERTLHSKKTRISILDLACGTGNYLLAQGRYYQQRRIRWFGCDSSRQMLQIASEKLSNVDLRIADAASLPYEDGSFDFIACNFAFHHFHDKPKAIREIHRTLRHDGLLLLKNICPEHMPLFWMYHFFPKTRAIDRERFWSNRKLFDQFRKAAFNVEIYTETIIKEFEIHGILEEAVNRDSSQLTLIGSKEYRSGISRIKEAGDAKYRGDFSILNLVGWKDERI